MMIRHSWLRKQNATSTTKSPALRTESKVTSSDHDRSHDQSFIYTLSKTYQIDNSFDQDIKTVHCHLKYYQHHI